MKSFKHIVVVSSVILICLSCLSVSAFPQTWTQLSPTGGPPPARIAHTAVLDSLDNMIVFGGYPQGASGAPPLFNDVWILSNADGSGQASAWTQLMPQGATPPARGVHTAVYDPSTNSMIVFGGNLSVGNCFDEANDLWVLANANGSGGTPAWAQITPAGAPPSIRDGHSAVYDRANNRMIVFGGRLECSNANAEIWVLANANGVGGTPTWTQLSPAAGPAPEARAFHSAVYDPGNNRMIIFGGATSTNLLDDVWVLTNANGLGGTPTWTQLTPNTPLPPGRQESSAIYDPAANTLTIFAGSTSIGIENDAWTLANANGLGGAPAWTQLQPTGGPPVPRSFHSAVFNLSSDRMTVFGGADSASFGLNDTWVLTDANGSPTIPIKIFNTGVADDGTLLPAGTVDPHYTVAPPGAATSSAFVVQATGFPLCVGFACPWLPDGPNSNWIDPFGPVPSSPIPVGHYTYTTTFDLTGLNPATATLRGQWISDNNGVEIVLNGNVFPFTTPFTSYTGPFLPFAINSGFVSGVNTLQFVVFEDGGITGLRAEVSGTAQSQVSATTTLLTSSANPSVFGQSVTFTATVSPVSGSGTPTGTVSFNDGAATLGTATLSGGQASFTTSSLSVASHNITAVYGGDANFTGSTSGTLTQAVNKASTATVLTSSPNPSVFNQSVTFTATVSVVPPGAGAPTGTVTFNDGALTLGTGMLSGGQASFTTSSLSVASHNITAAYGGDANFTGSTSAALTETVNKASTTTALTSSPNPSVFNQSVTFTATVSVVPPGAGAPTGTVTFNDGSTALATVTLSSAGTATFSTSTLTANSHSITAVYSGDTNFNGSNGSLTQQVAYGICVLYDQTRSVHSGATFPIKVELCDGNGNDVSSSAIVLHATAVTALSSFSGAPGSPGNANPDADFRFDITLGVTGGYIFNLSTSGLAPGTYSLQFTATSDPVTHSVNFGVN